MEQEQDIKDIEERIRKQTELQQALMWCFLLMFGLFCAAYFRHDNETIMTFGVIAVGTAHYMYKKFF